MQLENDGAYPRSTIRGRTTDTPIDGGFVSRAQRRDMARVKQGLDKFTPRKLLDVFFSPTLRPYSRNLLLVGLFLHSFFKGAVFFLAQRSE